MEQVDATAADAVTAREQPRIRTVSLNALHVAMNKALADMRHQPAIGLLIGAFYAAAGMLVVWAAFGSGLVYLAYPMAAGALLLGPFMAVGIYEVSRRREVGETIAFSSVCVATSRTARARLGWMPMLTLFAFIIWIDVAVAIYAVFFGISKIDPITFATELFTTPTGLLFIVIGNVVGAFFATVLFSISVVSYPMLLDRDTDFITAIVSSIKAVRQNPRPMISFALMIAFLFIIAALSGFVLMVAVLPFLGHTTWHLYRAVVE